MKPKILMIIISLTILVLISFFPSSKAAIIIEYSVPGGFSSLPREMVFDNNGWLWFTESGGHIIGRLKAGSFREYDLSPGKLPWGIAFDSSNEIIYFSDNLNPTISKIRTTGTVTEYQLPTDLGSGLKGIDIYTTNENGDTVHVWFAATDSHLIGLLDLSSGAPIISVWWLTDNSAPESLIYTPSTGLWCTDFEEDRLWNIPNATSPLVKFIELPENSEPVDIDVDTFGNLWFTLSERSSIGKYNPRLNELTEYKIPTSSSTPWGITIDYSNRVWFTESSTNKIGFFNPDSETFVEYTRSGPGNPTYLSTTREGDKIRRLPIYFSDTNFGIIGKIDPSEGLTTTFIGSLTRATTTSSTGFITTSVTNSSTSDIASSVYEAEEDATEATSTTTLTVTETVKRVRTSTSDVTTVFTTILGTTSAFTTVNGTSTAYTTTTTGILTTVSLATSTSYIATQTGTLTTTGTTTIFSTTFETTTANAIIVPGYQPISMIMGLILGAIFILGYGLTKKKKF